MVATCPVCRDVVHTYRGVFVIHGSHYHGVFSACAGSSTPYCSFMDFSCCG